MRRFEIGICLPNSLDAILKPAILSERIGFDSLWIVDAVMDEFIKQTDDLQVCMTALANATRKIRIGSCVMATCRYYPFNIARFFAALDRLSQGRTIAGLGAGVARQATPFGIPPIPNMQDRFREALEVIELFFTQKIVTYEGKYFKLDSVSLETVPLQKPHPPFWLGTNTDNAIKATARFADGWMPGVTSPETYRAELRLLLEAAEKAGRNSEEITPACFEIANISKSKKDSLKRVGELLAPTGLWWNRSVKLGYGKFNSPNEVPLDLIEKLSVLGSVEDIAQRVGEFVDAGVRHMVLYPMPLGDILDMLPRIAEAVELM